MTILIAAFRGGFRLAVSSPGLVLGLWLASVAVALPAAVVVGHSIGESAGSSLVHETLRDGFDMGWYGEYRAEARGLETTFRPTVVGAGAFYHNLESWIGGGLFTGFPGLIGVGAVFGLLWAFLLGGVLDRFARPAEHDPFSRAAGRYFFRFVRLALVSAVLYFLVYRFHGRMFEWLEELTRDTISERRVFLWSVGAYLLTGFLLIFVHVCFAYAKIATVIEDRRSMLLAALRGVGFVLSNPGRTLALYCGMALAGAILLALYAWLAPGAGQSSWTGIVFAFLVGQAFLGAKLVLRLALLGGETTLYRSLTWRSPVPSIGQPAA